MITPSEIEVMITNARNTQGKGWQQKVEMLKSCLLYLSTNPSPAFVEKEHERIAMCIKRRDDLFNTNYGHNKKKLSSILYMTLRKEHDKKYGTDNLRSQLEALSIILNINNHAASTVQTNNR